TDNTDLPEISVYKIPSSGDPIEIENEMYYACDTGSSDDTNEPRVGVIPLVVRNPRKIDNINEYIKCLSIAHRRIQFRKKNNICDFNDCDELIIS
ncbi:MAG TPA: hypothetical protein VK213_07595, partial [Bacteroidales bacterium]|nr:hypothetical protein [Bacteroidales bacterium]